VILETEHLLLRPFSLELIDAALANDHKLYEDIGVVPNHEWPERDLLEALEFFRSELLCHGVTGFGSWIVTNKRNEIIGSAGFIGRPDGGAVEIGFGIIPSMRKNGFCKESVLALVDWAMGRCQANRIVAHCEVDNAGSAGVLTSCGFQQVSIANGLIKWEYRGTGILCPTIETSLL